MIPDHFFPFPPIVFQGGQWGGSPYLAQHPERSEGHTPEMSWNSLSHLLHAPSWKGFANKSLTVASELKATSLATLSVVWNGKPFLSPVPGRGSEVRG